MDPDASPDVMVVVVTWDGAHLLPGCLDSLRAQTAAHRVLVVDNASTDGTATLLASTYPEVEVVALDRNTGFAGGVSAALERLDTRYVALLNNDAVAEPQWLAESRAMLDAEPGCAGVTAKMLLSDRPGVLNNAGVVLLATGYGADRGLGEEDGPEWSVPVEVFGVSGGATVLRTLAVRAVGGMEAAYFLYYEDTDLSWRLRLAGWTLRYCPSAVVHHQHSASTDQASTRFAFYNERNRLLTLFRCAPASFAAKAVFRFALTTASVTLRRPEARHAVFSPVLRVRVFGAVLARLPWSVRTRREITARSRLSRRAVLNRWVGDATPV